MRVQYIDLPPDLVPVAGPPTMADEQSISLRCLWVQLITSERPRDVRNCQIRFGNRVPHAGRSVPSAQSRRPI